MGGGDKDGITTDAIHVDARACLYVVQVDIAVFGDQVDHVIFGADLNQENATSFTCSRITPLLVIDSLHFIVQR